MRVALYVRVSTIKQADEGYSVDGQLAELREYAASNGLEVVREIVDEGEKRHTLERPGIEEIQELAAAGGIEEVWTWRWDRYGQSPWPEVLSVELEGMGVALRSLDDGGEGDDAELMRGLKSLLSKREQKTRVDRMRMGMRSKARRGELSGSAPKARYGFSRTYDHRGKAHGFEVDPVEMATIRRIIEMVADGESYHEVQRTLERERVPNPSGGERWSRTTIKGIVNDDVYKPHGYEEVKRLVSPEALAKLEEGRSYGISWYGQRRSYFTGKGKKRNYVEVSRDQWIAIPVPDSGIPPETIEKARERVAHHKPASKAGDRFWELSGGIVRCAECGKSMHAYRRSKQSGFNYYYRCRTDGVLVECSNRKSHPAQELEQTARVIFEFGISDPEREMHRKIKEYYESRRAELDGAGNGERRAALQERLRKIENKRSNFWEMAAEGDIPREVMRERVATLDDEKRAIDEELQRSADTARELEELENVYQELMLAAAEHEEPPEVEPTPQERRKRYEELRVQFTVDKDGYLEANWSIAPASHIRTLCPPAAVTSRARLA